MMKNIFFIAAIISCSFYISCSKDVPGNTSKDYSFDAGLAASTISVNDSASFTLSENPDIISFYSGEEGNNYDNKDRTFIAGGQLKMKFETRVVNQIADTLDVYVSTNFNGVYDSTNVANANWTKITNKFLYPDPTTPLGTFVPSGINPGDFTDMTSYVTPGQPFFLAFRYDITKQNNIEWSINKLGMYNVFTNGIATATVLDTTSNNSGAFSPVTFGEPASRWIKTTTYYKYINSSSAAIGASHWYISKPLNPNAVAPDLPIVLKNITQSPLRVFKYKYKAPGTYKAVFVASYKRLNFEKTIVKEFTVTVN